jgi:hypothetical protein
MLPDFGTSIHHAAPGDINLVYSGQDSGGFLEEMILWGGARKHIAFDPLFEHRIPLAPKH